MRGNPQPEPHDYTDLRLLRDVRTGKKYPSQLR